MVILFFFGQIHGQGMLFFVIELGGCLIYYRISGCLWQSCFGQGGGGQPRWEMVSSVVGLEGGVARRVQGFALSFCRIVRTTYGFGSSPTQTILLVSLKNLFYIFYIVGVIKTIKHGLLHSQMFISILLIKIKIS